MDDCGVKDPLETMTPRLEVLELREGVAEELPEAGTAEDEDVGVVTDFGKVPLVAPKE